MNVLLTRDSVAMSDDFDAPHNFLFNVDDNASVASVIQTVCNSRYLAAISGGKATWAAVSKITLAVLAQQWRSPKLLLPVPPITTLDFADNVLSLHFRYYTQQDPDLVYDQLYNAHVRCYPNIR
jgi:hypothetical protein